MSRFLIPQDILDRIKQSNEQNISVDELENTDSSSKIISENPLLYIDETVVSEAPKIVKDKQREIPSSWEDDFSEFNQKLILSQEIVEEKDEDILGIYDVNYDTLRKIKRFDSDNLPYIIFNRTTLMKIQDFKNTSDILIERDIQAKVGQDDTLFLDHYQSNNILYFSFPNQHLLEKLLKLYPDDIFLATSYPPTISGISVADMFHKLTTKTLSNSLELYKELMFSTTFSIYQLYCLYTDFAKLIIDESLALLGQIELEFTDILHLYDEKNSIERNKSVFEENDYQIRKTNLHKLYSEYITDATIPRQYDDGLSEFAPPSDPLEYTKLDYMILALWEGISDKDDFFPEFMYTHSSIRKSWIEEFCSFPS